MVDIARMLVTVPEDPDGSVHLYHHADYITLCGYCDAPYEEAREDAVLDCSSCIATVEYVRGRAVGAVMRHRRDHHAT